MDHLADGWSQEETCNKNAVLFNGFIQLLEQLRSSERCESSPHTGFEVVAPNPKGTAATQVIQYVSSRIGSLVSMLARSLGVPGHLLTGPSGLNSATKGAAAEATWAPDSKILLMLFEGSDQVITCTHDARIII
jgi:hypothetical protein